MNEIPPLTRKPHARLPEGLDRPEIYDVSIKEAMARVPRHLFVPASHREHAYDDTSLPIGAGQTISQPFIVALMTQYLRPYPGMRVLDVGTGSGYQAAVLAELGTEVFTIEILPALASAAQDRLRKLGYHNIHFRVGDGSGGWPEEAPFDGILVAAAAPRVPEPLLQQLAPDGRIIIPIEMEGGIEREALTLIERKGASFVEKRLEGVRFVPMVGHVRSV